LKRKECSLATPDSLTDRPLGWTANTNAPVPPLPFTNRLISHPIRPENPLNSKDRSPDTEEEEESEKGTLKPKDKVGYTLTKPNHHNHKNNRNNETA
jgi:hypothetical protein